MLSVVSATIVTDSHCLQSYGGFMSSKVVEADAGIHTLAMAVAVRASDWVVYQFTDFSSAACIQLASLRLVFFCHE